MEERNSIKIQTVYTNVTYYAHVNPRTGAREKWGVLITECLTVKAEVKREELHI